MQNSRFRPFTVHSSLYSSARIRIKMLVCNEQNVGHCKSTLELLGLVKGRESTDNMSSFLCTGQEEKEKRHKSLRAQGHFHKFWICVWICVCNYQQWERCSSLPCLALLAAASSLLCYWQLRSVKTAHGAVYVPHIGTRAASSVWGMGISGHHSRGWKAAFEF